MVSDTYPSAARLDLPGHVALVRGEGHLPMLRVENRHARAELYLHGAQLTAWQPHGTAPVLWLSERSLFAGGRAIRGGVPVCWPWFGPHPHDPTLPQHGFARLLEWHPTSTAALPDGATELNLTLRDDAATLALWPHRFELMLQVKVGRTLEIALTSHNTGAQPITVGGALHSYFAVADIATTSVTGLEGLSYLDQANRCNGRQQHALAITGEIDRVYTLTGDASRCTLSDGGNRRRLHIDSLGSRGTVVWNPGPARAAAMADFPDTGYRHMLCIETANPGVDARHLAPGARHTLRQRIDVETVA